jgi:hypothetical protein
MTKASTAVDAVPRARKRKKSAVRLARGLREGDTPQNRHWRTYFLDHLVVTSNVTASAKAAGIAVSRAYKTRQDDPEFAARWRVALAQGYENLEMELLGYLRDPKAETKLDVANAIRLLTLHRQSVAQQRAHEDSRSEAEVLDSIDAMIDDMRSRAAANAALIAADTGDEPDK